MARKIIFAKIKESDLITVGSSIEDELYKLSYEDKVWFEDGHYVIMGKVAIKLFVDSMLSKIVELEKYFTDEDSILEFAKDREFLSKLLKLKAS